MREAEFLLLDFFRSCVSGRSGVCVEWEEGGRAVSASIGGRGVLGAVLSAMVCVMLLAWLLLVKFMKIFCVVECVWMVVAVGVAVCFFNSFLCSLRYGGFP